MICFGQDEVVQLTQEIWDSMLNIQLELQECKPDQTHGINNRLHTRGSFVGGCVQITGAWEGAVRVDCCSELAGRAAAAFFGVEAGEVTLEQVRDAIGELANMSAGSIKPLLPRPCHIALPSVVDGDNYELTIRNSKVVLSSLFEHDGQPLMVTVLESERPPRLIQ